MAVYIYNAYAHIKRLAARTTVHPSQSTESRDVESKFIQPSPYQRRSISEQYGVCVNVALLIKSSVQPNSAQPIPIGVKLRFHGNLSHVIPALDLPISLKFC
jgi:hypothetical protein